VIKAPPPVPRPRLGIFLSGAELRAIQHASFAEGCNTVLEAVRDVLKGGEPPAEGSPVLHELALLVALVARNAPGRLP